MTIETKKQTETKERGNDINKKVAMLLLESPLETISMMKMRSKFEQALYQLRLNKIALVTEYRLNSKQYLSLLEMEYTQKKEYFESKINHIPTTKEEYEEGDALFAKINQLSKRFDITKAEEEQLLREQLITIEVIYEEKRYPRSTRVLWTHAQTKLLLEVNRLRAQTLFLQDSSHKTRTRIAKDIIFTWWNYG